ncbi:MAG TPA: methyltransferase domain-containing protein [Bryobacteraceae bacterium]|nr:methyltransferase domain-containing protein [Bryobacteraceae bacterium]
MIPRGLSIVFLAALAGLPAGAQQFENLAPYIPTPMSLVDTMLEYAGVKPSDVVYDLGSGDGRIVIAAAQKFGARGVGIEMLPELCRTAERRVRELGLQDRVSIVQGSALHVDLSPATVVTMYLLTSSNERLRPSLEKYLKPGARVVSTDYPINGWKATRLKLVKDGGVEHKIYVYQVGQTK